MTLLSKIFNFRTSVLQQVKNDMKPDELAEDDILQAIYNAPGATARQIIATLRAAKKSGRLARA